MKAFTVRPVLPPVSLVMAAVVSTQIGSALAKTLFAQVGPTGVVFLRMSFAAALLFLVWRPPWRPETRQHLGTVLSFGLSLALMNFLFYQAIARIPLGVAVALEFTGPLGLAVVKSRQWVDVLWVLLAAVGVVLLAPTGDLTLDWLGMGLALLAGLGWAAYIVMSARVGQVLPGIEGLAWAMAFGAVLLAPLGLALAGKALLNLGLLAIAIGVALLSSALPYSLELIALRRLPVPVFGVLLSIEPMVAAVAGFLVLGEALSLRAMVAIGLISVAAAGAARQPH
jgi:inner membrane transporter RhtA